MTHDVDAHHHVWDLAVREQPWMVGPAMDSLRRAFGVDDLAPDALACGVGATVVVMTVADVAETVELLALAAASPLVAGVVGYVDLAAPDVDAVLDRLLNGPGGSSLVGVRSLVEHDSDPRWLAHPDVGRGLRAVAARGVVFDLLVRADQLPLAGAVVDDVTRDEPDARFVLDHLAKPAIATGAWEPWASDLAALATRPNVAAKLSGLVTEASWADWTVADLRPYADHALTVFGTARVLFGSDWPVCRLAATYADVVDAARQLIAGLSPDEQCAVMGDNARRWYGLESTGSVPGNHGWERRDG